MVPGLNLAMLGEPAAKQYCELLSFPKLFPGLVPGCEGESGAFPGFDFSAGDNLPPGALLRPSTGWYINSGGLLVEAAIDEPRYDYAFGRRELLVEPASTPLIYNSNDPTKIASNGLIIDSVPGVGPDGNTSEWKSTDINGVSGPRWQQDISVTSGEIYWFSAILKAGTLDYAYFQPAAGGFGGLTADRRVWFDIRNGTVGTVGAQYIDTIVYPLANGYYYIAAKIVCTADNTGKMYLFLSNADGVDSIMGTGTGSVYFWQFQVENKLLTSPTVTTDFLDPRAADSPPSFDHALNQPEGMAVYWGTLGSPTSRSGTMLSAKYPDTTASLLTFQDGGSDIITSDGTNSAGTDTTGLEIGQQFAAAVRWTDGAGKVVMRKIDGVWTDGAASYDGEWEGGESIAIGVQRNEDMIFRCAGIALFDTDEGSAWLQDPARPWA